MDLTQKIDYQETAKLVKKNLSSISYRSFMSNEELIPEVLARRAYHVRNALASFALEGEYPSKEAEDLFNKFASGEIETIDELRVQINLLYSED